MLLIEIRKMMMKNNNPMDEHTLMNYNTTPIKAKPQNKFFFGGFLIWESSTKIKRGCI